MSVLIYIYFIHCIEKLGVSINAEYSLYTNVTFNFLEIFMGA